MASRCTASASTRSPPCPPPLLRGPLSATAINNHGHVTGYYRNCITLRNEGFIWTPETGLVTLTRPPGVVSMQPLDINDAGVICGAWANTNIPGATRGFVYWPDTQTYTELDTQSGGGWGMAHAINNSNVVVGERATTDKAAPRIAFVWSQENGFTDIGELAKNSSSAATDISEDGLVVGWNGPDSFTWRNGQLHMLGHAPNTINSRIRSIGEYGDLPFVGRADVGIPKPFSFNGEFVFLPLLDGDNIGTAYAVRNRPLQIGGFSRKYQPPISEFRGVMWVAGNIYDLNDWTLEAPARITEVAAINAHGEVLVSTSTIADYVLTPVNASAGDINGDRRTDRSYLLLLLNEWNNTDSPGDLNRCGRVDIFDLLMLLDEWTG